MAITSHIEDNVNDETKPKKGLLDLPSELWSKIGKIVVDDSKPCRISVPKLTIDRRYPKKVRLGTIQTSRQPDITRTCKLLRAELLPYYYGTKVDVRYFIDMDPWPFFGRKWLRALGPKNRSYIRDGIKFMCLYGRIDAEGIRRHVKEVWKIEDELSLTEVRYKEWTSFAVRFS